MHHHKITATCHFRRKCSSALPRELNTKQRTTNAEVTTMGGGISKHKLAEIDQEKQQLQSQIKHLNNEMHTMEINVANLSRDFHNSTIENDVFIENHNNTKEIIHETDDDDKMKTLIEENKLLSTELKHEVEARIAVEFDREKLLNELKEMRIALTQKLNRDLIRGYKVNQKHVDNMKQLRIDAEEKVRGEMAIKNDSKQLIDDSYDREAYEKELKGMFRPDMNYDIDIDNDDQLIIAESKEDNGIYSEQRIADDNEKIKQYELMLMKEKSMRQVHNQNQNQDKKTTNEFELTKRYSSTVEVEKEEERGEHNEAKNELSFLSNGTNLSFSLTDYDKSNLSNTLNSPLNQANNNIINNSINNNSNILNTTNNVIPPVTGRRYSVLVDASSSMRLVDRSNLNGKSRWNQAQLALQLLVPEVLFCISLLIVLSLSFIMFFLILLFCLFVNFGLNNSSFVYKRLCHC